MPLFLFSVSHRSCKNRYLNSIFFIGSPYFLCLNLLCRTVVQLPNDIDWTLHNYWVADRTVFPVLLVICRPLVRRDVHSESGWKRDELRSLIPVQGCFSYRLDIYLSWNIVWQSMVSFIFVNFPPITKNFSLALGSTPLCIKNCTHLLLKSNSFCLDFRCLPVNQVSTAHS